MSRCVDLARRVARTSLPVTLLGPSGSGKSLLAQAIHAWSPRADGPFVAINAAAIPASLFEAELLGAEAGAFTDAGQVRIGHVERAAGGTLLLDEIGALATAQQATLLRVLDANDFHRVGGDDPIPMRARIIAATSADLATEVAAERFRTDLFHRLTVLCLHVPALADRPQDLPELARAIALEQAERCQLPPRELSPDALDALADHAWTGNVRELENVVTRAALAARGDLVTGADVARALPASAPTADLEATTGESLADIVERAIDHALSSARGDVAAAAKRLGVSRATVYRHRRKARSSGRGADR